MDLVSLDSWRSARSRDDLALVPGEEVVAGGTWLFSEPQSATGLVDLTTMDWEPWRSDANGLHVAATCTIAELVAIDAPWPALRLVRQCAESLLMSFKIWNTATVGGNICLGLPAGAMISLAAALDAEAVCWTPDGDERRIPVLGFVTGEARTVLGPGEVLRSIEIPAERLSADVAFRRVALSELGRSAALVIGVRSGDHLRITVTASTPRPERIVLPVGADHVAVASALGGVSSWFDDPHGDPLWRAGVTAHFVREIVEELS